MCNKTRHLTLLTAIILACAMMTGCSSKKAATDFARYGDDIYDTGLTVKKGKKKGHKTYASKEKRRVVEEACTWIGTPYKYAMQNKGEGTDCSGLVMVVYNEVTGLKMPRNSAKQAEFCQRIREDEVEPGDLVFFATGKDPDKVSHVGIMVNSTDFVHASSSKGVVISTMNNNYYIQHFMMYGRVPLTLAHTP